jgi:hypothetical protein
VENKLRYRLITGKDDASFCERISKFLEEGYKLYGSPSCTFNGEGVIVVQAIIINDEDNKETKSNTENYKQFWASSV